MREKKDNIYLLINIFLPLLIGGGIYCFLSPDVIFVNQLDSFMKIGFHVKNTVSDLHCIRLIRNHLPDALWGYALVFALYLIIGNIKTSVYK